MGLHGLFLLEILDYIPRGSIYFQKHFGQSSQNCLHPFILTEISRLYGYMVNNPILVPRLVLFHTDLLQVGFPVPLKRQAKAMN